MSRSFKRFVSGGEAPAREFSKHKCRRLERLRRKEWLEDFLKGCGCHKVSPQYDVRDVWWFEGRVKNVRYRKGGRPIPPKADWSDWKSRDIRKK